MFQASRASSAGPALADLIRLRNQTGSVLLLFPTLWALVLASDGHPPLSLLAIFTAGAFVMRSAGVTINDLWDRDLDRRVQRTRDRPLASGRLSLVTGVAVFAILILLAAGLAVLLNPLAKALALPALCLAVVYPLAKRVVSFPQVVLGAAFGMGTLMAWAAVRNEISWPALGLFLSTVCWATGYDTIYAMQDQQDDQQAGIRSTAILFGRRAWLAVLLALLAMLIILCVVGMATRLAFSFYLALGTALLLFGYQARCLQEGVSASVAFRLFKQHAWIGVLILAGIWSGVLLR